MGRSTTAGNMRAMHAGVLHGVQDIAYEQVEYPVPAANEVVVKVRAAGICNSDIERFNGKMVYNYPLIPGHEISGEIYETGRDVKILDAGQRVTVYPLIPCNKCAFCSIKRYNLCDNYSYIGSRTSGGFAEFVKCPATNILPIGKNTSFEQASLVEPLAVGLHAVKRAGMKNDSAVLVYGLGPVGLFTVQWAEIAGAKNIIAVDRNIHKLDAAKRHGATATINSSDEDIISRISELTEGRFVDCVMECSGAPRLQEQTIATVKKGGTVVFVGNAKQDVIIHQKEMHKILRKEINITGSWNSLMEDDWKECIRSLESGEVGFGDVITHKFRLKDIKSVFSDIVSRKFEYLKIIFID